MSRKIYPCEEFSPIEVPLSELIINGEISIYPEAGKFFDLDWRNGRLVIAPKSYVGLIPINENIAIRVLPRFPIGNLFWIVNRSSTSLQFINGHLRQYEIDKGSDNDPLNLLAKHLTQLCIETLRSGVLRRYLYNNFEGAFGGNLQISPTISNYRATGIRHISVWQEVQLSAKLKENQLLKAAMTRVLAYFSTNTDRSARQFSKSVQEVLFLLDSVPELSLGEIISEPDVIRMVESLPRSHHSYGAVLWLSYLIYSKRGISVESIGSAKFHTFVINMAEVFEDYVRAIIRGRVNELIPEGVLKNGNVDQVPLFRQGDKNLVKPDIYILNKKKAVLVMDAKYKPSIKAADRYEVLAFCEALGVNRAIFLLPGEVCASSTLIGVTPQGTSLHLQRINLADNNMQYSEDLFIESLRKCIT